MKMKNITAADFSIVNTARDGHEEDGMTLVNWKLTTFLVPLNDVMRKHLLLGHKTHSVPGKQLPIYCCLQFWFMDNMNLSTKPHPST